MNVLLANDTGRTNNPGCQATSDNLKQLIKNNGHTIIASIPVGYGKSIFENCYKNKNLQNIFQKIRFCFGCLMGRKPAAWNYFSPAVDLEKWTRAQEHFERDVSDLLENIELLIINGEGTMHHNQASALALIAMAIQAKRQMKKVWLVNATVQNMDSTCLTQLVDSCDHIAIREPFSFKMLAALGNDNICESVDCAFLLDAEKQKNAIENNICLYTPGVLTNGKTCYRITHRQVVKHLKLLQDFKYNPVFLSVEVEDNLVLASVRKLRIPVIELNSLSYTDIISTLQKFSFVVSGRFHILIFSYIANVPFIPIESNTWKIEGFLDIIGTHKKPVRTTKDLRLWLQNGPLSADNVGIGELRRKARQNCCP